jgi:hypothetical protein
VLNLSEKGKAESFRVIILANPKSGDNGAVKFVDEFQTDDPLSSKEMIPSGKEVLLQVFDFTRKDIPIFDIIIQALENSIDKWTSS